MLKESTDHILSRRELLVRILRFSLLALLFGGGLASLGKRRRLLREGKCLNSGICPSCRVFTDCGHPRALSLKAKSNHHPSQEAR